MNDLPPDIRKLIDALKQKLASLTDDQRLEVFDEVRDGYCRHCGGKSLPCHCWNDE